MTAPDVPCGLLVLDDELQVRQANPAAAALLGAEPGDLVGRPIRALLTPGARMFFHTHVHPSLGVLGRVEELYLELVGADGTPIPIVVDGRRTPTPDGPRTTLAFLAMRRRRVFEHELVAARDAAEASARDERAAHAQLAAAHAQLALQERLASLGTLAQGIAHEINNPLTTASARRGRAARPARGRPSPAPTASETSPGRCPSSRARRSSRASCWIRATSPAWWCA